ncbi:MAG TPA: hypothetical protein PKW11_13085, partial [Pseudomonadota bacterium]|nr:hypothetical protein [Pseudomonadota bacterium]
MKRTLGFLMICALAACEGPAGDKGDTGLTGDKGTMGDKGDKGDPGSVPAALGSLTPSTAFPGRTVMMQLAGVATHFSATSSVTFDDPAIKVTKVELGGNANLRLTVEIGLEAKMGAHDVTISSPPTAPEGGSEEL